MAMGAARPCRRSRRTVPARRVSGCGAEFCGARAIGPRNASSFETRARARSSLRMAMIPDLALIRPHQKRTDRDDVAIAIVPGAVAQRFIDGILFAGCLEREAWTPGGTDSYRVPSA